MSEPWVLVADLSGAPESVELPGDEGRHVSTVLRLGPSDRVVVADGRGRTAVGRLTALGRGRLAVELEPIAVHSEEPPGVTLAAGVLHGKAQELIVRQAVEVGVRRFIPLLTERTQLGAEAVRGRLKRWRRIAWQAIKQCRRPWVPEIAEPMELDELVDRATGLVADPGGAPPGELDIRAPVTLLVGPEGGLTAGELERAIRREWAAIALGEYTLRAETAAVAGAAIVGRWCQRPTN